MSTAERRRAVLLIAESADPRRGGQERSITEFARAIGDEGWEVTLASAGSGPEGLPHIALAGGARGRGARTAEVLRGAEELARGRRETMVVHAMLPLRAAHLYTPRGGLYAEAYLRSRASRGAWWARGAAALALRVDRRRQRLLAAEADLFRDPEGPRVLALSDYVRRQVRSHYPDGAQRVRVVRNGVAQARLHDALEQRAPLRRSLGIDARATVFLAMAHNFRLKGIPQLRAAARLLPERRPWVILVAGGARVPEGDPRFRFLGVREDGAELIAAADVVVHPTFYDPCSRVVLEALALGRPVVATRWDGAAELVGAGGVVLDDPRDVPALAAALETLLDPDHRRSMASAAAGRAGEVSMARQAKEMSAFYAEVVASR